MAQIVATDWPTIESALRLWIVNSTGFADDHVIWAQQGGPRPTDPWVSLMLDHLEQDGIGWTDVEDNPLVFAPLAVTAVNTGANTLTIPLHGLVTGDGGVQFTTTGTLPSGLALATDYWVVVIDANTVKIASHFVDAMNVSPVTIALGSAGTGTLTLNATDDTVRAGLEILQVVRAYFSVTLTLQCYAMTATGTAMPVSVLQGVATSALLPSVRNALEAAGVGPFQFKPIRAIGEQINSAQFEPRAVMECDLWVIAQVSETGTIIEAVDVETTAGTTDVTDSVDTRG